jgi:HTH-type transcriptional regulator / antitoxin HigA
MSDRVVAQIPVGQFIAKELEERDWTQADFAAILGRPTQFVSEIITGKKEITRESAAQIGAALGMSPDYFLNLQNAYLLDEQAKNSTTQRELNQVRRRARLNELAPISILMKRGIIRGLTTDEQESEVKELFELGNIHDEPAFALAARRSNTAEEISPVQLAWVACVRRRARASRVPNPFDFTGFADLARNLANLLKAPRSFRGLPALFAAVGVILVYVEALPGARIDGCAFYLDGKPVIGLSGRGKRLDKILFTLLHEVAHLILGHVHADGLIIEEVDQHSHENECEEKANSQAGAWILPRPLPDAPERINQAWVSQVAEDRGLAPIVVIGQLQNMRRLDWRTSLARNAPTVTEELASW